MARTATAVVLALFAFGAAPPVDVRTLVGQTLAARVVSVVDGDTIDVTSARTGTFRVRLEGIDTPERGEPFSRHATNFTRVLLFDKMVSVEGRDVDRYARLVARVRLGSANTDSSAALLTAGLACHYKAYSSDARLAALEEAARRGGVGFWSRTAARPRCASRTPVIESRPAAGVGGVVTYHGNTSSKVYHAPWCRNFTCRNCTQVFHSETAARAEGYRAAQDCLERH